MTSPRQWWRRAAAAVKDKRSLYLTRLASSAGNSSFRNPDLEVAVIRATSHDERSVDYKNSARVFAWARASPSFLHPLMWALSRRAARTRSWVVALKTLMLVHGLLMRSDSVRVESRVGRLPFDLSDFRDRSSSPAKASGFSSFVRAYFNFLDNRSIFSTIEYNADDEDQRLDRVQKLQTLLDLLMQIRPYTDGMEVALVLEAMDCVLIEIFEVYSQICNGIACFLVGIFSSGSSPSPPEIKKQRGMIGMRVLRKATEQSSHLSAYFELCHGLGVLNAAELPEVERIPDEDIRDLEKLVVGEAEQEMEMERERERELNITVSKSFVDYDWPEMEEKEETVVTKEWVLFEEEGTAEKQGPFGKTQNLQGSFGNNIENNNNNTFAFSPGKFWPSDSWASFVSPTMDIPFRNDGNLIELI